MAVGLLLSALANFFFGMNAALGVLVVTWCLNGWFQGMGSAPGSRIMTHWFHPQEIGWYWSLWALSNHVGLAVVLIMAGYLGQYYGWRFIFWVPAGLAGLTSLYLLERLRDTPASLGLPEPEVYGGIQKLDNVTVEPEKKQSTGEFISYLLHNVFNQPLMWAICVASFLDYVLCYAFVNWVPTFLAEKGMALAHIGWMVTVFEVFGAVAGMLGGWLTDKACKGQRAPVCVGFMVLACFAFLALWQFSSASLWVCVLLLILVGFSIYGPRLLIAVMATDLATKKAAATAVGMTGLFGFLAGLISGWGLGHVLDHHGWANAFLILALCSVANIVPLAYCWNLRPKTTEEAGRN